MAGDWIKMQKDTPDKPEVLAIASRLGIDPDAVTGKLVRIWSWFDTHTTDGNASCVTFAFLDRLAGVTGFAEQMALVGWLSQKGHDLSLPNFDYHTGETAKKRALGQKRQSKHRSNAERNAANVTNASPEKRREEKSYSIPDGIEGATSFERKRAARLPDGWQLPKAWGEWALTEYPAWTADIVRLEGQKFADHWRAKAGKDGAKLDWEATWRNWCRSDICQRTHSQKPTFAQQAADVARTTVPSRPGKDQTLEAIEADRAQCGPPPEAVRQKLAELVPKLRVAT